ncbi:uncharacterized protein LOC125242306 isoform X2 [Leguminivora glycinivorella]|uniref:uncharacterized protein LOC125242306 isoform X2 n=1 Tax=Leguminivora glycinivorella TaxID=1035111 RepID=UPI00200FA42D|nr:uncharacterized protein LOC125242306 isoform X2 [Leguminivora glycinivorella]
MREGNLLKVNVMPISKEVCLSYIPLAVRIFMYSNRHVFDDYICATRENQHDYGHDLPGLSQGASGSPLVHQGELAGLAVARGDPWQSNLFTFLKIGKHTEWIRFITGITPDYSQYTTPAKSTYDWGPEREEEAQKAPWEPQYE